MLAKDLLGGGRGDNLTLTIYPNGLGNAKIGSQFLASWDAHTTDPFIINYSDISNISDQIRIYIDGISDYTPALSNIRKDFYGLQGTSTYFRGYIIDKSKSSILNWS